MSTQLLYTTSIDERYKIEREENKKVPIFQEEDDLPRGALTALYLFKFVQYATKDQVVRWANLSARTKVLKWLYLHGYLDGGRLSQQSQFIFWIDKKGASLLEKNKVTNVKVPLFTVKSVMHGLGVTEALLKESAIGRITALNTEFNVGNVKPDIYIERGENVYFIEFDNGTETFVQLKKKFKAYGESDYVNSCRAFLHVYYSKQDKKEVIKNALVSAQVQKTFVKIFLIYLDMGKVIKSKTAQKKLQKAVAALAT